MQSVSQFERRVSRDALVKTVKGVVCTTTPTPNGSAYIVEIRTKHKQDSPEDVKIIGGGIQHVLKRIGGKAEDCFKMLGTCIIP